MSLATVKKTRSCFIRGGSRQGTRHIRLNQNNQDACTYQTFSVPVFDRTYHIGLVSDGCSGNPMFSHSEVGAHLLVLYAYRRIQELICSHVALQDIPKVLYPSITEFLLDIMTKVMPSHVLWKYPVSIKDRQDWNGQTRFKNDFLSATLLGFIADELDLIVFSAGDGIVVVDDEIKIIDQNNQPDYPSISVNRPSEGFQTVQYQTDMVQRVAITTDGLDRLVKDSTFRRQLFESDRDKILGLQTLLNVTSNKHPELMLDDCTAVCMEVRDEKKG